MGRSRIQPKSSTERRGFSRFIAPIQVRDHRENDRLGTPKLFNSNNLRRPSVDRGFMRVVIMLFTVFLSSAAGAAESLPAGGTPVVGGIEAFGITGRQEQLGTVTPISVTGQSFSRAVRLGTQDGANNEWDVQIRAMSTAAVKNGDVLIARFWARCTDSMTGEGATSFVFEIPAEDHRKLVDQRVPIEANWREYFLPFRSDTDLPAGAAQACFRMGFDRQTIELADVQVINFGPNVRLQDLPRTAMSYSGREADAKWRKEANDRIDKIRKGDLKIRVVNSAGAPVANANVQATLVRHAFGFGSCVTKDQLTGNSTDDERCREIAEKYFNRAVFENDMKWPAMWDGPSEQLDKAVTWLLERNIQIRGHNLHWPSWRWSPRQLRELESSPGELRRVCDERVTKTVAHFKGKLIQWDVINEPYNNRDLMDILGDAVMTHWFKLARAADPDCKLYLNDFGILDGGTNNAHRAHFYKTISELKASGAPIDGIGIQSHFAAALPPPSQVIAVLDQFTQLGLPIELTEISIALDEQQLQADYMRDFMIAVFSHPNVNGAMLWGFWEGRHWRPTAALWTRDWQLRPLGQAWLDLVHREWKTDAALQTDSTGTAAVRGFLGDYEIKVNANGKSKVVRAKLSADGTSVDVVID